MIIQLKNTTQINEIQSFLKLNGLNSNLITTQFQTYLIAIGKSYPDLRTLLQFNSIQDVHRVSEAYKLVSNKWKIHPTTIDLGNDIKIGGGNFGIMSGPCSIEGEENIEETVKHLVKNNIKIMRGGVFKPRSSPYAFRGLGIEGLKMFYNACRKEGIKIVTEVMRESQIDEMIDYVDIFQVGARNSQNFNLLDALGQIDKPILLKRAISGTIDELLQGAEYIFSNGNEKIILCERGIRTYEKAYRNTLDLNAVSILKEKSHLPVVVDPSHGVGIRSHVGNMALAGIMAGADGIIVETHACPEKAFSDGQQTLSYEEAEKLYEQMNLLFKFKAENAM
jgi:3-deoxy-7-phosphoheptulonate synthase